MYPISQMFADYLRRPDREFIVKATVGGVDYDDTQIVDFSIENTMTSGEGFELGTAIPSMMVIRLRTINEVPPNAKIVPWIAVSLNNLTWPEAIYPWNDMKITWESGTSDWMPLGEFYVDTRSRINDVWEYTCYDKLVWGNVPYISSLTYPATYKDVWDEICNRLGFQYDASVILANYTFPVAPTGFLMREVLAFIAGANCANVFIGKDGVLRFKRFGKTEPVVFDMKTSDYVRVKQTNPVKTYTKVVVMYDTEDDLSYTAGTGEENNTLYLTIPYATQQMTNNILAYLNGFSYLPVSMDSRGFPQLDPGDVISFAQIEGHSWLDTTTAWVNTHIPWDGIGIYRTVILTQTLDFKGGLKLTIQSPSISDQQSEFAIEGSLTQQVNNLDKNAVKEGKRYYGATITRNEGIVIERDDHASKAVFNSDELSFYAGSERALWFDIPSRKFKFTGTLEGVDGKFTGTIEGGKFIGGSIQIGSSFSVNNAGHMTAVGGDFSGTITASVIEGGRINGTYIDGSVITGGVFRTAANGRRIETSSQGFGTFDSRGNNRLAIKTSSDDTVSAISFFGSGGAFAGEINAYGSQERLNIFSNDLFLGSNSTSNPIYLQGATTFNGSATFNGLVRFIGNVSGLNLSVSDISGLSSQIDAIWNAINNHTHSVNIGTHNHGNAANQNWGGTFTTSKP